MLSKYISSQGSSFSRNCTVGFETLVLNVGSLSQSSDSQTCRRALSSLILRMFVYPLVDVLKSGIHSVSLRSYTGSSLDLFTVRPNSRKILARAQFLCYSGHERRISTINTEFNAEVLFPTPSPAYRLASSSYPATGSEFASSCIIKEAIFPIVFLTRLIF
jgi:hypothetical protein